MLPAKTEQHLSRLRRAIATSEALPEETRSLALGVPAIDAALGGGLPGAALHEVSAPPAHHGAAAGFALALAALAQEPHKETLWIATDFGSLDTGALYGPGLDQFGLASGRLLLARVARPVDALFAMEEALKCRALSAVIAELGEAPDLTATRRLSLAAKDHGGLGLILRQGFLHNASDAPSAARTRWQVTAAPSVPDEFGGLGPTAFSLELTRNRRGPCGTWTLTWDHHERVFAALSLGVAEADRDRPDRETLRTG
jgi:protein ImuA